MWKLTLGHNISYGSRDFGRMLSVLLYGLLALGPFFFFLIYPWPNPLIHARDG